jgi:hypothetical protein
MKQNGDYHLNIISATIIDLAISGATLKISHFPLQIQILLEKCV